MIARVGKTLTRYAERYVPDPFVLVLVLTLGVFALGLLFGQSVSGQPTSEALHTLAKGWYGALTGKGLMKFALQMCIVLITGHALALSRPVQGLIRRITSLASTPQAAVVVVAVVAALASLFQWGLGVIVGAFLAREMGRAFAERGEPVHYPLLGAAGYAGFIVWHGGLSGSAPLKVAEPGHFLEKTVGVIPVTETLGSALNLATSASIIAALAVVFWAMMPRDPADMRPFPLEPDAPAPSDDEASAPAEEGVETAATPTRSPVLRALEETRLLSSVASLAIFVWLAAFFASKGLGGQPFAEVGLWGFVKGAFKGWNLDSINLLFLALGLMLHESPTSYVRAVADGARGCAGIILQFPFYFGILGVLKASGLIVQIAAWFVGISSATTFPIWTFLSAGLVNFLVPSGGGQWAVQGPVMMQAVKELGVSAPTAIMALSYGDAWTNMIQPFWALPLLGIMRLEARDIIGYTTMILLATAPVIIFWLVVLG